MKIEVGKTYRAANGYTVKIIHDEGYRPYTLRADIFSANEGIDRIAYYMPGGSYMLEGKSEFDIVSAA